MGKPKRKQKRKSYSETFRNRAVRIAQTSGKSVSAVALELNVSDKTLYSWLRTAAKIATPDEPSSPIEDKLRALRDENDRLRARCLKLRKAAAYLAEEI